MTLLKILGLMTAFGFSLQGWGWGCRRVFRMGRGSWPVTVTLGLGAVVFLGGILNLARLAVAWSLAGLVIAGLILAVWGWKQNRAAAAAAPPADGTQPQARDRGTCLILGALAAAIMAFTIRTQLPPRAYNYADDYQKYFAYPVRMLETGTLFGSPLSAMGSESLGGQSFLHGFVVAAFPVAYLNAVDAVFGLFLCLVLAIGFTAGRRDLLPVGAVCVLGVVFINPQYVNISTLYLGSALMMALIALSVDPDEMTGGGGRSSGLAPGAERSPRPAGAEPFKSEGMAPPNAAAMGLLYATLIVLKLTLALFVALHGLAVLVVIACFARKAQPVLRWGGRTALAGAIFLAPWILLHGSHYLAGLRAPAAGDIAPGDQLPGALQFFSGEPLFHGATMAHYTWLTIAMAIGGLIAGWVALRTEEGRLRWAALMTAALGVVGVGCYIVIEPILAPTLAGYAPTLRYYTPFAIGIAPAVFGLAALQLVSLRGRPASPAKGGVAGATRGRPTAGARSEGGPPATLRWVRLGLPLVVAAAPVAAFWPSLHARVGQAWRSGSILAFRDVANSPAYLEYNQRMLNGPMQANVAKLQALVPAGEPIVAWIDDPFYLDYARNRIIDVDAAGLTTRWAVAPPAHYVIWDYAGPSTRSAQMYAERARTPNRHERLIALRGLAFFQRLGTLAQQSQLLYNDGATVVFRVNGNIQN